LVKYLAIGLEVCSVQTVIPLDRVVLSIILIINKKKSRKKNKKTQRYLQKGLTYLRGSGISPNGNSPKLLIIGAFENCKC
jgi:hypothetical protein